MTTARRACRCEIINIEGEEIAPGFLAVTPVKSLPHIGKQGWAAKLADGFVFITLDDGTRLSGDECWWRNLELREPLAF